MDFCAASRSHPGAPRRIRLTKQLCGQFVEEAPRGYLAMQVATARLAVPRQTVMDSIKRGKPNAGTVRRGCRRGLGTRLPAKGEPGLFEAAAWFESETCSEASSLGILAKDTARPRANN